MGIDYTTKDIVFLYTIYIIIYPKPNTSKNELVI